MAENSVPDAREKIQEYEVPSWHPYLVFGFLFIQAVLLFLIICWLCNPDKLCLDVTPNCTTVYINIAAALIICLLIVQLWLLSARFVHEKRLVDEHKAKNLIGDIDLALPRYVEDPDNQDGDDLVFPESYKEIRANLNDEINRIRSLERDDWVEFQFVSVQQLWSNFMDPKELKAEARSTLEDLQDFAENPKVQYDTKQYWRWETRISRALEDLETKEKNNANDYELELASEDLRNNLKILYYHIADYSLAWSRGAVLIRLLLTAGFGTVLIFAFLGLLPLFSEHPHFSIFNWSMLAAAGAVTGVLKSLHKADTMEVGDNDGNHEIWRAIATVPLGMVAGIAIYGLIATGAISDGFLVPPLDSEFIPDNAAELIRYVGTHLLWPLGAGFLFEATYSRL